MTKKTFIIRAVSIDAPHNDVIDELEKAWDVYDKILYFRKVFPPPNYRIELTYREYFEKTISIDYDNVETLQQQILKCIPNEK